MTFKKELTAGEEIDSRCLKCKDITNHTIVAMVGDKVAKVQCNVCRGLHNYRPVTIEKKTGAPPRPGGKAGQSPKTGRTAKEMKAETLYRELLGGRETHAALPYAMTAAFQEDDLISHAVFGLGVVMRKIPTNKVEVMFLGGSRILICAPDAKK